MARTWFTNEDGKVVEFNVPQEVADHITDLWDMIGRNTVAQCTPSREGLYSAFQIPSKYLQDAPPISVEEDNVFAPRKVEVVR